MIAQSIIRSTENVYRKKLPILGQQDGLHGLRKVILDDGSKIYI